jgi:hypothetical protein
MLEFKTDCESHNIPSLWRRIKYCFRVLMTGYTYPMSVIFDNNTIGKVANHILYTLKKAKVKRQEDVSGTHFDKIDGLKDNGFYI